MSEQVITRANADLRQLLVNPTAAIHVRPRRLTPRCAGVVCAVADKTQIVIIGTLTLASYQPRWGVEHFSRAFEFSILAAVLAAVLRQLLRMLRPSPPASVGIVHAAAGVPIALVIIAFTCPPFEPWTVYSPDLSVRFLLWGAASGAISAAFHYFAARLARTYGHRVVVVGAPETAERLTRLTAGGSPEAWHVVGHIDDRAVGGLEQLIALIDERGVDLVAIVPEAPDVTRGAAAICRRLADRQIRLSLVLDIAEMTGGLRGIDSIGHVALVDLWACPYGGWRGVAKRTMDLGLASLALVLLAPLMVGAAVAIRLETPGPVLFRQWRFGVGSRPIQVLKFRTMYANRGDKTGALRTASYDSRVSPIGRFLRRTSIDELPQLINVLRGDMSIVGPRPHPLHMRIGDVYYFEAVEQYRARHIVRPGITGWAQINGSRGEVATLKKARRRVELDLWYLEHWSLALDVRILLRTVLGGFASLRDD